MLIVGTVGQWENFVSPIRGFQIKLYISSLVHKGAGAKFPLSLYFAAEVLTVICCLNALSLSV